MKASVVSGWIVAILAFALVFSLIATGSDEWSTQRVLVQDPVYEDVPSSEIRVKAYWVGTTALSIALGLIAGLLIWVKLEEGTS